MADITHRVTGSRPHTPLVVAGLLFDTAVAECPYIFPVRQDDQILLQPDDATPLRRLDDDHVERFWSEDLENLVRNSPGEVPLQPDDRIRLHIAIPVDRLRPRPEDETVVESLPHLASVAMDPDSRLLDVDLKVAASRSRRPANRAAAHLAARSEDWLRRRPNGVVPGRLLDRRLDQNFALYDNLIASALISTHLPRWVKRRIESVQQQEEDLREAWESFNTGSRHRLDRMTRVLARPEQDAESASATSLVSATESLLRELAGTIRHLAGSPLARAVGRADISLRPTRTNRMLSDQHYRHLPRLFDVAVHEQASVDVQALRRHAQVQHRAMVAHSLTLLLHGLEEHGYAIDVGRRAVSRGDSIELAGPWEGVRFTWSGIDTLELEAGERRCRFVPLAVNLPTVLDRHDVRSVMAAIGDVPPDTYILHHGSAVAGDTLRLRLRSAGYTAWDRFIVVEQTSAGSVERVGAILTRLVAGAALEQIPQQVRPDNQVVPPALTENLPWPTGARLSGGVELWRPVEEREREQLASAVRAHQRRSHDGSGWQRLHTRQLESVLDAVDAADSRLRRLLRCPVCGQAGGEGSWFNDGDLVRVSCRACHSWWGTMDCGRCRRRFGVIRTPASDHNLEQQGEGWIGRVLGRDVLAEPCWNRRRDSNAMVCPHCDSCSLTGKDGCPRGCRSD